MSNSDLRQEYGAKKIDTNSIKRLIWLYFWLLIFEGAIRKWILPQLASPLLIVRDPVVFLMYFLAIKNGVFPKNIFVKATIYLAFIFFLTGLIAIVTSDNSSPMVALYGLRTNFFYLPLIFLISQVFTIDDVKKIGRWVLILSIPMAILMILQFSSSPDDFINRAAGLGEAKQLTSAMDKIRPPGTFSFITGAAQYLSLVASFLLYGLCQNKVYPLILLSPAAVSLILALAVSGSRTAIGMVFIVFICYLCILLIRPSLLSNSYKLIGLAGLVAFNITLIPFFSQGIEVTTTRINNASEYESSSGGFLVRFVNTFLGPFNSTEPIPFIGYGLGLGTNVGAALTTGKVTFLLAEEEWQRIVLESGFLLGLLYIILRISLVLWIATNCYRSAVVGNILPILLFGSCALLLLNGQFGQPTTLGFAVLVGGLCLASRRVKSFERNSTSGS